MHNKIIAATCFILLFQSAFARGVTMRYALVIGNNIGVDEDGAQPFPALMHAEQEAKTLRSRLVGISNFDASSKRTKLLINATRADVRAAFKALVLQKKADQKLFSQMESIFLLYFTGHGLSGRLLLADGPLSSKSLVKLFNKIGADFSVGIFDACYAGSLDTMLKEKGIRATRGLNIVKSLPEEVLSAKGSIWYVSSGAGEPSYEDKKIGGVFTHFFIEALEKAEKEGPGITLDRIWQYTRSKTIAHTAAHNRHQIPEQIVARLRSKAPIYFSFPTPRDATLVLAENLSGHFALSYADGHLVEVFDKPFGKKKRLAVYPGSARLMALNGLNAQSIQYPLKLTSGATLVFNGIPGAASASRQRDDVLFNKGADLEMSVQATDAEKGVSVMTGAGYGLALAARGMLHPRHRIFIPLRLNLSSFIMAANLSYGVDKRRYSAWSYTAHLAGGQVRGGYQWTIGRVQPCLGIGVQAAHIWQIYDQDTDERTGWQVHLTGNLGMVFPKSGNFFMELIAELGPLYTPGAGAEAGSSWQLSGGIALAGYYRLI